MNSPNNTAPPRATSPAMSGAAGAINYSKFRIYNPVDSDLDSAPTFEFPFITGSVFRAINTGIDEPAVQINYEDCMPGPGILWRVLGDAPFRHLCICVPNPGFAIPVASSMQPR